MPDDLLKRALEMQRGTACFGSISRRNNARRELIEDLAAALESDRALLQEAQAEVLRVRDLINRDKTGLAQAIDEMVKEAQGRLWIVEGRGSYEWDDERYRKEAGLALRAVVMLGKKALTNSGALADSAFHPEKDSDRALLRRIGDALDTWDAIAPTVLNAPTSLFVRTVRSIIDEARARVGQ